MKRPLITKIIMAMVGTELMSQTKSEKTVNAMSLDELLYEYELIGKKTSKLTLSQRAFVVFKVDYLFEEGYLYKAAA